MMSTNKLPFGAGLNAKRNLVRRDGRVTPRLSLQAFTLARLVLTMHPRLVTLTMLSGELTDMARAGGDAGGMVAHTPRIAGLASEARRGLAGIGIDLVTEIGKGWRAKALVLVQEARSGNAATGNEKSTEDAA